MRAPNIDIMMPHTQHQGVRTTLTLDDDVAVKLKADRAAPVVLSGMLSMRRCVGPLP